MRYLALAVDYDGTLALDGRVARSTVHALERVAASGRRLILVTGRELPELLDIFPDIGCFDLVVAENGALLYRPASQETELLARGPGEALMAELQRRGVSPLSAGKCIVATVRPHEVVVLEVIQALGLELQVIFNKEAVMVLPPNVNKAYGLMAALGKLALSPHNVVAIGDAENDHALLQLAEYSAAVANAVPALKETADHSLTKPNGEGVVELIEDLLAHDLKETAPTPARRTILLGSRSSGERVSLPAAGVNVLVAGASRTGKSTLVTAALERLAEQRYQFCVIDPESDYQQLPGAVILGSIEHPPSVPEIQAALRQPDSNVVIDLVSLSRADRSTFFTALLPTLFELRAKTGRPHWIVVDETHQLMPADWTPLPLLLSQRLTSMLYVTVHPHSVAPAVLKTVGVVAVTGETPTAAIDEFCQAAGVVRPSLPATKLEPGEALVWPLCWNQVPFALEVAPLPCSGRA